MPDQINDLGAKYHRRVVQTLSYPVETGGCTIDVYDVLTAFNVYCPALQHAIKKLLCCGIRGYKNHKQDCEEAIRSIQRGIELGMMYEEVTEDNKPVGIPEEEC